MHVIYRYLDATGGDRIDSAVGELSVATFLTTVDNPTAVPPSDIQTAVINVAGSPVVYHLHMASGFNLTNVPFSVILPD